MRNRFAISCVYLNIFKINQLRKGAEDEGSEGRVEMQIFSAQDVFFARLIRTRT